MPHPLVSISMITYGHENFIRQAIEGVLMQKCNFTFELIISNDHSDDNTDKIIKEYLIKNTNIKYFNQTKNLGIIPNFLFTLNQAQGKYIAICEGDDYWTDPLKLQKQVDFIDKNPDFSIVFHQIQVMENKILTDEIYPPLEKIKDVSSIEDLSQYNYIPTLSVLFRNPYVYPDYFIKSYIGDYPLHLYNAEKGKIKCIPEVMGVYRKGVGIWSAKADLNRDKKMLQSLQVISHHYKNNPVIFKNLYLQQKYYLYSYLVKSIKNRKSMISVLSKDEIFKNISFRYKLFFFIKFLLKKR